MIFRIVGRKESRERKVSGNLGRMTMSLFCFVATGICCVGKKKTFKG